MVGVYVEDIIYAHNCKRLTWVRDCFTGSEGVRAENIGSLHWFLGLSVEQTVVLSYSGVYSDTLTQLETNPQYSEMSLLTRSHQNHMN